jgi:hypothetical protein
VVSYAGPVTGARGRPDRTVPAVVIAEDSVLLLAGLTKLLDHAGFEVSATAADATGLLDG